MQGEAPPLLILREGDPPRIIAHLPDELLDVPEWATRAVGIRFQTYQHIGESRSSGESWHFELVIRRMAEVIQAPTHIGNLNGKLNRLSVYKKREEDPCGIVVNLKQLAGETWVCTGHPVGAKTLQKYLLAGSLKAVKEPQRGLFGDEEGGI